MSDVTRLSTGGLAVYDSHQYFDGDLYQVAERQNPKRSFLFVSTILGRHIPADPADLHQAADYLAGHAAHVSPGKPVLVMGFAETAVGLGAAVAHHLRFKDRSREVRYLATTRHPIDGEVWFEFSEDHSHAAKHYVLKPAAGIKRNYGALILVDDEMSTGNTMRNLATALLDQGVTADEIVLATLTDWSHHAGARQVKAATGVPTVSHALLYGRYMWLPDEDAPPHQLPPQDIATDIPAWTPDGTPQPRTGAFVPGLNPKVHSRPGEEFAYSPADMPYLDEIDMIAGLPVRNGERTLVIGTGEYVWRPFNLAAYIRGICENPNVRFVATTRSPVLPGGAIRHKIEFPDHYGEGRPMYLHNVKRDEWDAVILMTETGLDGIADSLKASLAPLRIIDGADQIHDIGGL